MEKKETASSVGIVTEADRKMAFVTKIVAIEPIKGADRIELATVLGWKIIVKKDEFKIGDLCIYFSLMSMLDENNPEFEHLKEKGKMKPLKSKKLKGALSQGLLTSVNAVKFYGKDPATLKEGDDVTEIMKVTKFVLQEEAQAYAPTSSDKSVMIPYPSYIPKTDEERIQNIPKVLDTLTGKDVVVTRKEDGSSGTFVFLNGTFLVCSRNYVRKQEGEKGPDIYMDVESKFKIGDAMKAFGKNIGVQGEIVGPGINKGRLGLKEIDFRVFNIYLIDEHRYANHEECSEICEKLHLNSVPLLYKGKFKPEWSTVDGILKYSESIEYSKGAPAEGIVVKGNDPTIPKRISFKAISNKYLLKHNV